MTKREKTITEYIIEEQRKSPGATGGFSALLNDIRLGCKRIAHLVGKGALAGIPPGQLRQVAHDSFLRTNEWGGHLAALASKATMAISPIPREYPRGRYLLIFDPLVGAPGLEVNAVAGSLFSVLRLPEGAHEPSERDFLQPGAKQVCAGYAIYGPTTMLVYALEGGVNGFTLDREMGEFILTHPGMRVAGETSEFAINTSNARFWEPAVKRYVDECLAGKSGPRGCDFNMRWAASLVADAHRILLRGGVFLYPCDSRDEAREGRHELVFEANPIGWVIERAGGRASTGEVPLLDIEPAALRQRTALVFGSRAEVERIERYHRDHNVREFDHPLFGSRGLFRTSTEV
ncbi:MAG: class 1 fructose-bisphosphatase [Betaproteobacteria bacterium]|nr:class 1 fructose-bisphosphatase [Betaproteobacteria bacterium]